MVLSHLSFDDYKRLKLYNFSAKRVML